MKLTDALFHSIFVFFLILVVLVQAGCGPTMGSRGPLVRGVTPEGDEVIVDQATMPTTEVYELPEAPPVLSPEVPVPTPAAEAAPAAETAPAPAGEAAPAPETAPAPAPAPAPEAAPVPEGGAAPEAPAPAPAELTGQVLEYRIQPGDVLDFQSLDDEMLNRPGVVVRYDGYVSLPLIPDIQVQGKTRDEAADLLKAAYTPFFKDTPQLTLTVVSANSRSFHVVGAVQSPGEFPYQRPISVLAAVYKAGGLRTYGSGSRGDQYVSRQGQLVKAFVIRHSAGQREVFSVNLQNIASPGPHPSETPVLPGDIVFVPEGLNLIYVLGEIRRPDVYHWTEGLSLLQLLAAVGGPEFTTGSMTEVVLLRQMDPKQTKVLIVNVKRMLRTGESIEMRPGDVVYVPRKRLVNARDFVQRFTGTVSPIMNLYTQAYDTYYTDERFDRIFEDNGDGGITSDLLAVTQGLRDFGSVLAPLTSAINP